MMRDPDGAVEISGDSVLRTRRHPLVGDSFLRTPAATSLVASGKLIPFSLHDSTIESPRIPFVSYPHEWCDAQLFEAAQLTLDISKEILADGYELKDASAWNVLFDRNRPIFCDHLSFERISDRRWWPFGQFARHFIFPLYASKYRGIRGNEAFLCSRDGFSAEQARRLMGSKRFLSRLWPLLLNAHSGSRATPATRTGDNAKGSLHGGLYSMLGWVLDGAQSAQAAATTWSDYETNRPHYSESGRQAKLAAVREWLTRLRPSWVTDLGCNTGEFSRVAVECGASAIAVDSDWGALEQLFKASRGMPIYPVLATLDDLPGGRGWAGTEALPLVARMEERTDTLLMLAITHHLAISSSIPYERIAALAARITSRHAILEIIEQDDPMVLELASRRNRSPGEFSSSLQLQAFRQYFDVIDEHPLEGGFRKLLLLSKHE